MAAPPITSMPPVGGDPVKIGQYVHGTIWAAYHQLRQPWIRQVEANIRNLAGRQYDEYVPELGEVVDLSELYLPGDDRWRRAPVMNWLGQHWFKVKLAKLTENQPLLGALPSSSDLEDAATAGIFDPFFRFYWSKLGMPERQYPLMGWVLTAGEGIVKFRWDPNLGDPQDFYGSQTVPMLPGSPPSQAPYVTGPPSASGFQREKLGDLAVEVVAPTTVLYPYGPWMYWEAPWVMQEYLLHVDEARARWARPDLHPTSLDLRQEQVRVMAYSSYYGNPGSPGAMWGSWDLNAATRDMVLIRERWQRDTPLREGEVDGQPAVLGDPYGRLTVCAQGSDNPVLDDGINPYVVPGVREKVVIPFVRFRAPGFPFRQEGVSDLENLIPIARAWNRNWAGKLDYADLNEQPPLIYNGQLIADDQVESMHQPGKKTRSDGDANAAAAYLQVPPLPPALEGLGQELLDVMHLLGHADAAGGTVPNDSRSGELLTQDRFNTDRPDGAMVRAFSYDYARCGGVLLDIAAACMEDERVLAIGGEDQALTFLSVRPDLFQGRVNIYPQPESAVLETREDKQNRITQAMMTASQLMVASPQLAEAFLKGIQQPDLYRIVRPGGAARVLAERQIAEMVQTGQLAPIFPEQDHAIHIATVMEYMQGLSYRDLPEPAKMVLRAYKKFHEIFGQAEAIRQATEQATVLERAAESTGMPSPSETAHKQVDAETAPKGAPLKRVK